MDLKLHRCLRDCSMLLLLSSALRKCFLILILRAYSSWLFSKREGCSSCGIGMQLSPSASALRIY